MDYSSRGGSGGGIQVANLPKLSAFIQPPLNRFFIPRPSLAYRKPIDRAPEDRVGCRHSGIGPFLQRAQNLSISSADPQHSTGKNEGDPASMVCLCFPVSRSCNESAYKKKS